MLGFIVKGFLWIVLTGGIIGSSNDISMFVPAALISTTVIFIIPAVWRAIKRSAQQKRWQLEDANRQSQRDYAEEQAHQTSLRREEERLLMQQRVRVQELIAVLEVQARADQAKLEQIAKMKAELSTRQNSDMANLLARLEAMKG